MQVLADYYHIAEINSGRHSLSLQRKIKAVSIFHFWCIKVEISGLTKATWLANLKSSGYFIKITLSKTVTTKFPKEYLKEQSKQTNATVRRTQIVL